MDIKKFKQMVSKYERQIAVKTKQFKRLQVKIKNYLDCLANAFVIS